MAMANELTPEQKLQNSVCLIRTYDELGNVQRKGTGFMHCSGGWITTAAHIFQNSTVLSHGRFDVQFDTARQDQIIFQNRRRMAFICSLGDENEDIAMVKLGKQWEYCRNEFDDWENDEDERLKNITNIPLVDPTEHIEREVKYAAYYDGADDTKKFEAFRGVLPVGSSGCPIVVRRSVRRESDGEDNDEYKYCSVGLYFFERQVKRIPTKIFMAIREIGIYMASRGVSLRLSPQSDELHKSSTKEKQEALTRLNDPIWAANFTVSAIYLPNGEVINLPGTSRAR